LVRIGKPLEWAEKQGLPLMALKRSADTELQCPLTGELRT
jgi:hypothetical protein